ncbi:MAG: Mo-dependent nitrogenase C-terminal domain-containing protein [Microcoleus sp.]
MHNRRQTPFDPLYSIKQRLDEIEVKTPKLARLLCQLIPAQCPFEREVKFFDRPLFYIPPLCKLNPVYEQLIGLRFRALCYLADECGEDVMRYC